MSRQFVFALVTWMIAGTTLAQDFELGKEIFRAQCVSCHGDQGQGNKEHYDQPLFGDLSVRELAKVIQETMPEEKPGSLTIEQATAVAVYAHHEFYSSMAQMRNAPPTIDLSHLTVQQFRQSVADLMRPFTGGPERWSDKRGLKRTISNAKWGKERFVYEEDVIDSDFHFDWKDGTPLAEMNPEKWHVRWEGSLYAPETGVYEFYMDSTVRSNLYLNITDTPFIDAAVVSFESTLNTGSIFLIGGRTYSIAFDANKSKEPTAKFSLEWKVPQRSREPIPAHYLSPTWSPPLLVSSAAFPPDDSSVGYERGRGVSREWDDATTSAAIEIGNILSENTKRWMPGNDNNPGDKESVKRWCVRWVSVAFRHKLTDEEAQIYVNRHFENEESIARAIKKVCLLCLKSPLFQYPSLSTDGSESNAAMLALALWDSVPDESMLEQSRNGGYSTPEQVAGLVESMLDNPRSTYKINGFFQEYLGIRYLKELSKDAARYPEFNAQVASDLRVSLDLFLSDFSRNPNGDVRQLLTADYLYLNGRLAKLYGLDLPSDAPFQRVAMPPDQRSGVLSHPYLMSGLAYHATSSPIHRGVFLAKRVLGRNLRPPVDAIIPVSEEAAPNLTTRERVAMQTSGAMCQTCHRVINPLGFTLEHYDALGRYRSDEQGKAIDSSGAYVTTNGDQVEFRGVREMGEFLANSPEVHQSIVKQLFQYLVKQPLPAYGLERTAQLDEQFAKDGFAMKPLIKNLMVLITSPNSSVPLQNQ